MTRAIVLAVLAVLVCTGCPMPRTGIAGETFAAIGTREIPLHVRITGVSGDWAGIVVVADVTAEGASWASLTPTGDLREGGVTRRLSDGAVELELEREWWTPQGCEGGVCELDYVVSLDAEPTAPWDLAVSVTIDGDGAETAHVEVRAGP